MDSIIQIKVAARAKKSEVAGRFGDGVKIRIAAQPDKGAANNELVRFLAKALQSTMADIEILSGWTSPIKMLRIRGLSKEQVMRRLELEL